MRKMHVHLGRARSASAAGVRCVRPGPAMELGTRHDCEGIAVSGPSRQGAGPGGTETAPAGRELGAADWWVGALRSGEPAASIAVEAARGRADVAFDLPAAPGAPGAARELGARVLGVWGMDGFVGDAELVLSELVTNAVRHGLPAQTASYGYGNVIRVRLLRRAGQAVCAVQDPSVRVPSPREPDLLLETGRGLHLVGCFSQEWGVVLAPPRGKYVWALFA